MAERNSGGKSAKQAVTKSVSINSAETTRVPVGQWSGGMPVVPSQFGRYRLVQELGRGAMGHVFLAEDTQLRRQIALKIPKRSTLDDPEALERFYREARTAATLKHPNICPVFDVGGIDGIPYLTMAYVKGKPVGDYLRQDNLPPARQVALLIRKIARAIDEAHRQGIVHRDLKPSNVMLDDSGEPIVMDFGLARLMNTAENAKLTQSGAILGTPAYMAPEQVRSEFHLIGPTTDIYSLGVMMYQFLTGELPFTGPVAFVLAQVITKEPQLPSEVRPDVDPALEAICLKMMAKEIPQRYAGMSEVVAALTEFLKTGSVVGLEVVSTPEAVDDSPESEEEEEEEYRPRLRKKKTAKKTLPAGWLKRFRSPQWMFAATMVLIGSPLIVWEGIAYLNPADADPIPVAPSPTAKLIIDLEDPTLRVRLGDQEITAENQGLPITVEPGTQTFQIVGADGESSARTVTVPAGETLHVLVTAVGIKPAIMEPQKSLPMTDPVNAADDKAESESTAKVDVTPVRPKDAPPLAVAPFDAGQAKAHQEAWAKHLGVPVEYENTLGMKLRLIPPGKFTMGRQESVSDVAKLSKSYDEYYSVQGKDTELPHMVEITSPYYISQYETTKDQFSRFISETSYSIKSDSFDSMAWGYSADSNGLLPPSLEFSWQNWGVPQSGDCPVCNVSWYDSAEFCRWLNATRLRDEKFPPDWEFRLPSEAEWEYACRAGSETMFPNGVDVNQLGEIGNVCDEAWAARYGESTKLDPISTNDGQVFPCPVGRFRPNAFGLSDMAGNVFEWCWDWYGFDFDSDGLSQDPAGLSNGFTKVRRGGAWGYEGGNYGNPAMGARCAGRNAGVPCGRKPWDGFRIVCGPKILAAPLTEPFDHSLFVRDLIAHRIGESFDFNVTGNDQGTVSGIDIYTASSTISAACVHAGVLNNGQSGVVRVTILAPRNSFEGSTRNGVKSVSSRYTERGMAAYRIELVKLLAQIESKKSPPLAAPSGILPDAQRQRRLAKWILDGGGDVGVRIPQGTLTLSSSSPWNSENVIQTIHFPVNATNGDIGRLADAPQLQLLSLRGGKVDDDALDLIVSTCPSLELLFISGKQFSAGGCGRALRSPTANGVATAFRDRLENLWAARSGRPQPPHRKSSVTSRRAGGTV